MTHEFHRTEDGSSRSGHILLLNTVSSPCQLDTTGAFSISQ